MSDTTNIVLHEPPNAESILLVEDDVGLQAQMRWALDPHEVQVVGSRDAAMDKLTAHGDMRIVILDLGLPPDQNGATEGLRALDEILGLRPQAKVIVVSGNVDRANAVRAVGKGAFDFIAKPIEIEVLKLIIQRAIRMGDLEKENKVLREDTRRTVGDLIFASPKMGQVVRMIERIGPMNVSALLTGETGTGKEVVARALHSHSPRRALPFIAINCASIPDNLLESELFGHERGAFTGAIKRTQGKFELAHKGTLFLDEIGDMPLSLQSKLLRFLQERRLERVGGRESIQVDVRLISATNKDLRKLIAEEKFREDLYYRLNEVRVELPPLKEREDDITVLAQHFLNKFTALYSRRLVGFSQEASRALSLYQWPGNVRELENRVKRAVVMAEGTRITPDDLDLAKQSTAPRSFDLRAEVEKLERRMASEALAHADGNISKAAKLLGISRPSLYNLLNEPANGLEQDRS